MTTTLSPESNAVTVEELEKFFEAGEPWPAELCEQLGQYPSAMLRDVLHTLKVRTHLRRPFVEAANLSTTANPDLNELLRRQFRRDRTRSAMTVNELTMLLKWQFHHVIQDAGDETGRVLRHAYQVQVQPPMLRHRMRRLLGLSFLPGRHLRSFLPGEQFVPLSFPRVLTLAVRSHRLGNGKVIDMFDVKLHALSVDAESGAVMVGGPTTLMAKHFNFGPSQGQDRLTVSVENVAVVEGALALHEAMEQSAIDGASAQAAPVFPDIYLGFRARDEVSIEYSEALQSRVLRQIDAWFRRGRPTIWPDLPVLAELNGSLLRSPRSWPEIVTCVGEPTSKFLQEQAWDHSIVLYEGLFLAPAEYFEPYSVQRPVQRALQAFAHFPSHLMGRDVSAADGERNVDDNQARAQVILRHNSCVGFGKPEQAIVGLQGTVKSVDYNFTSVPPGLEKFFVPAAEPEDALSPT